MNHMAHIPPVAGARKHASDCAGPCRDALARTEDARAAIGGLTDGPAPIRGEKRLAVFAWCRATQEASRELARSARAACRAADEQIRAAKEARDSLRPSRIVAPGPELNASPRQPWGGVLTMLRVVLADDHEVVRTGLRALVDAAAGMHVVGEAGDGAEAVARARELRPDVVVMDISMPGVDGAQATERIARELPGVRVIALTAHDDRAHLTRLLQAGAAGYVLKRSAADELVRAIRTVGGGGTWVDPVLAGTLLRGTARPFALDRPRAHDTLSEREEEVLRRVAWGESNKQIAEELEISTKTVETYKTRITDKLGLRSRTEMVRYAVQRGWLSEG